MKQSVLAVALAIALFSAATAVAEAEQLIASWENTMAPLVATSGVDWAGFTTWDGVTLGTYALELDLKPGWQIILRSASTDPDPFFPQMAMASKLRLDVTTSNSLAHIPMTGTIDLGLTVQGQETGGMMFAYTYASQRVNAVYSTDTATNTIQWDLSVDALGNRVPPIPDFSAGGWFDLAITANVTGGNDPGIIELDNLRAVEGCGPPAEPGDFNHDKTVNQADYTRWADYFGWTGMPMDNPLADDREFVPWPGSDRVDQADYTRWADNYGMMYAMPEPATLALLAMGAAAAILRRRAGAR